MSDDPRRGMSPEEITKVMARGSCTYVEDALRMRQVRSITFHDGGTEITTFAIGEWHEHGHGGSLFEALADLDDQLKKNPPPKAVDDLKGGEF